MINQSFNRLIVFAASAPSGRAMIRDAKPVYQRKKHDRQSDSACGSGIERSNRRTENRHPQRRGILLHSLKLVRHLRDDYRCSEWVANVIRDSRSPFLARPVQVLMLAPERAPSARFFGLHHTRVHPISTGSEVGTPSRSERTFPR